jgi:hypothetical protein
MWRLVFSWRCSMNVGFVNENALIAMSDQFRLNRWCSWPGVGKEFWGSEVDAFNWTFQAALTTRACLIPVRVRGAYGPWIWEQVIGELTRLQCHFHIVQISNNSKLVYPKMTLRDSGILLHLLQGRELHLVNPRLIKPLHNYVGCSHKKFKSATCWANRIHRS